MFQVSFLFPKIKTLTNFWYLSTVKKFQLRVRCNGNCNVLILSFNGNALIILRVFFLFSLCKLLLSDLGKCLFESFCMLISFKSVNVYCCHFFFVFTDIVSENLHHLLVPTSNGFFLDKWISTFMTVIPSFKIFFISKLLTQIFSKQGLTEL